MKNEITNKKYSSVTEMMKGEGVPLHIRKHAKHLAKQAKRKKNK